MVLVLIAALVQSDNLAAAGGLCAALSLFLTLLDP